MSLLQLMLNSYENSVTIITIALVTVQSFLSCDDCKTIDSVTFEIQISDHLEISHSIFDDLSKLCSNHSARLGTRFAVYVCIYIHMSRGGGKYARIAKDGER